MDIEDVYRSLKKEAPDSLIAIRSGDFYEFLFEDAKTAGRILELTITTRTKDRDSTPMTGFPHQSLERYVAKLVAAGHKVAVADQVPAGRIKSPSRPKRVVVPERGDS